MAYPTSKLYLNIGVTAVATLTFMYFVLFRQTSEEFQSSEIFEYELYDDESEGGNRSGIKDDTSKPEVTIGVAICGSRLEQAITMLKSVIMFSKNSRLRVFAFQDDETSEGLRPQLNALKSSAEGLNVSFNFWIRDSWFPNTNNIDWRNWFMPCSTQRLFFSSLLPHVDKILHLDTDLIVLTDILNLWNHFNVMNGTKIGAMAAEHELPGDGWYNTRAEIPYFGPRGLNAGVMLMDLDAMRRVDFEGGISLAFGGYRQHIQWADQDLMNVYFHFHNEWMHLLPCHMNYRVQHCKPDWMNTNNLSVRCLEAETSGISILHGNRNAFAEYDFTQNIYNAFKEYDLDSNDPAKLLERLQGDYLNLKKNRTTDCASMNLTIFHKLEEYGAEL